MTVVQVPCLSILTVIGVSLRHDNDVCPEQQQRAQPPHHRFSLFSSRQVAVISPVPPPDAGGVVRICPLSPLNDFDHAGRVERRLAVGVLTTITGNGIVPRPRSRPQGHKTTTDLKLSRQRHIVSMSGRIIMEVGP